MDFYFPLRKDWKWEPVKKTFEIEPGDSVNVWDYDESGWLVYALVESDNPLIRLMLDIYADNKVDLDLTIKDIYETGNVGLGAGYFNVTVYDPTKDRYVVQYSVPPPGLPFRGKNRFDLVNNIGVPIRGRVIGWLIILKR